VREIDEVCVCVLRLRSPASHPPGAETQRRRPLRVTLTVLLKDTGTCETDHWPEGRSQRLEVRGPTEVARPLCCFLPLPPSAPQLSTSTSNPCPCPHTDTSINKLPNSPGASKEQGARSKDLVSRVPVRKPRSFKKSMLPPGATAYVLGPMGRDVGTGIA
jgi:hypothetical protein